MTRRFKFIAAKLVHGPQQRGVTGTASGGGGISADPDITFTAFTPASSVTAGGSVATLTGTGYVGPVAVTFGAASSNTVTVASSSQITCTVPVSSASGAVSITITQGSKSAARSNFTYFGVPTVTNTTPVSGGTAGGTVVTITGTQFVPSSTTVRFNNNLATGVVAGFSSLTCLTPSASTVGAIAVTVQNVSGTVNAGTVYSYISQTAFVFNSDWAASNVTDGGKWSFAGDINQVGVVSVSTYGFPSGMTYGYAVYLDGAVAGVYKANVAPTVLAENETRYWRVYQYMGHGTGADNRIHNAQMAAITSPIPMWLRHDTTDTATYIQEWENRYDQSFTSYQHRWGYEVNRNQTYRYEWSIKRLANDFAELHWKIFDSSNNTVASDASITCIHTHGGLGAHALTQGASAVHHAEQANANIRLLASAWSQTRDFEFTNGGGSESLPGITIYGGFAISNTDWPGPYTPSGG